MTGIFDGTSPWEYKELVEVDCIYYSKDKPYYNCILNTDGCPCERQEKKIDC